MLLIHFHSCRVDDVSIRGTGTKIKLARHEGAQGVRLGVWGTIVSSPAWFGSAPPRTRNFTRFTLHFDRFCDPSSNEKYLNFGFIYHYLLSITLFCLE
jgi:hypothetical protein